MVTPYLRNEFLVCYDIEDNKSRTVLYKQLLAYGLLPLQKSVLWGLLTSAEFSAVNRLLATYCHANSDKGLIIPTHLTRQKNRQLGVHGYTQPPFKDWDENICL